ncbi:MAG: hypothetical protein ACRD2Y_02665 [Terriglobales bacterium]
MKPIHALLALLMVSCAWQVALGEGKAVKVEGWMIDSSCAYTKDLKKPISESCAKKCAEGGSPMVILTDDGTVYLPISGTMPATSENKRLMAFAGQRVKVEGTVHDRAGSKAMVIGKIEAVKPAK